ncbi:MAG: M15 family metallopeptidase [Legionellales bacterium]
MLLANSALALPQGFVDVQTIAPSIIVDLRYIGDDNFIGRPIPGYKDNRAVLTLEAAQALKKAQELAKKDGYSLVIYDAYRPQRASGAFKVWSKDINDMQMQAWYYPRINKKMLFEENYIAEFSSHNRGSTVDITLISLSKTLHAIKPVRRTLEDGFEIWFLDDGTVDMGSSFDLFDKASHYENDLVTPDHKKQREYLRSIMAQAGFDHYPEEWWHFTLKNEPFPETYFDF